LEFGQFRHQRSWIDHKKTPIEANYVALTHTRLGEPSDVLKLTTLPGGNLEMGADDIVIAVKKRLVHPGDVHMIRGASNGGTPTPIDTTRAPVPGFKGVGVVEALGDTVRNAGAPSLGHRVVFFAGNARSWATKVVVSVGPAVAVPNNLKDEIAAQILMPASASTHH
jgi:NADPH:quinone reductase-like Zn-dependent oxidoreductase